MLESSEILTIGHSTHPIERFRDLLGFREVEVVADVRRFPGSRRKPQFNAGAIADSLRGAGIDYVPLGEELKAGPSVENRRRVVLEAAGFGANRETRPAPTAVVGIRLT